MLPSDERDGWGGGLRSSDKPFSPVGWWQEMNQADRRSLLIKMIQTAFVDQNTLSFCGCPCAENGFSGERVIEHAIQPG
jgi:hypothetical protein